MKVVRVLFSLLRTELHELLVGDRLAVLSGRHIKYCIILQEHEYAISYQYMINSSHTFSHNTGTSMPYSPQWLLVSEAVVIEAHLKFLTLPKLLILKLCHCLSRPAYSIKPVCLMMCIHK